jgi:uncharacterized protein (DUF2141 family)
VAPILALAVLATSTGTSAASGINIDVNFSGLRNAKGQIIVCLATNPKTFPDCGKDPNAQKKAIPAGNGTSVRFSNVMPGTYAIAVVHDENKNAKMDLTLFLPKEGWGLSRNPKMRMGKPKFSSSAFLVTDADLAFSVVMKYM